MAAASPSRHSRPVRRPARRWNRVGRNVPELGNPVGASTLATAHIVGVQGSVSAGQHQANSPPWAGLVVGFCVAAKGGREVMLDTSAVMARGSARGLMKPGGCAVICSTASRVAGEHGFSTAGLPVVADGTSATLRSQVAQQLRAFGANAQGFDNVVVIGATALERGVPLITGTTR